MRQNYLNIVPLYLFIIVFNLINLFMESKQRKYSAFSTRCGISFGRASCNILYLKFHLFYIILDKLLFYPASQRVSHSLNGKLLFFDH